MASAQPPDGEKRDGRVQRGERSREAIVAALLELVGEGFLEPTAQLVAERAGVGIRSVFRHFSDMDGLFAAMHEQLRAWVRPALDADPPEGTPCERAIELVRLRVLTYERIAPYKRSANLQRWRSPFLADRHEDQVRELRADLLRWLPELEKARPGLEDALDLVTSFEAWERLRSDQRLGHDRARAAMEQAVRALVQELDGGRPR